MELYGLQWRSTDLSPYFGPDWNIWTDRPKDPKNLVTTWLFLLVPPSWFSLRNLHLAINCNNLGHILTFDLVLSLLQNKFPSNTSKTDQIFISPLCNCCSKTTQSPYWFVPYKPCFHAAIQPATGWRKCICKNLTKTGGGFVFPGGYPQVTMEQLD